VAGKVRPQPAAAIVHRERRRRERAARRNDRVVSRHDGIWGAASAPRNCDRWTGGSG
jgi:hypothetical protein